MIGGRRQLKGRKTGDRRVRVERPHSPYFRYTGPGALVAREAASVPRTRTGRALARVRHVVFGRPLANEEEIGERLSKKKALAIFSSDAISSSAYATEEILRVLLLAGAGALLLSIQVSIAIAILLAVVSVSYRQVCRAYPNGGGAYVVARTNLGADLRADRGRGAAHRLRHDRGGVDGLGDRADPVGHPAPPTTSGSRSRSSRSRSSPSPTCAACASPGTSSRSRPTCSSGWPWRSSRIGAVRIAHRDGGPDRARARRPAARHRDARDPAPAQGLRRGLGRADRRRGDRQRRTRLQAARSEERGEHDDGRWPSCSRSSSSG